VGSGTPVDHMDYRYRRADTVGAWTTGTAPAYLLTIDLSGDFQRGEVYQIEVRNVGTNGAASEWAQVTHTVASISLIAPPPTSLTLLSNALTAIVGLDGVVRPRVLVEWTLPADLTQVQVEHKKHSDSTWIADGMYGIASTNTYVSDLVSNVAYDLWLKSLLP
jgi:hypothetical protein